MKKRLIDTDILSYYFREEPNVTRRCNEYIEEYGFLSISSITCFEILAGLRKRGAVKKEEKFLEFCQEHEVLGLGMEEGLNAGEIYADLQKKGESLSPVDTLIAAIALTNEYVLVTNNIRHFSRIKRIEVENWLEIG